MQPYLLTILALLIFSMAVAGQNADGQTAAKLTPKALHDALAAKPTGAAAQKLADQVRDLFGKEALLQGADPKVDGQNVAFAIEAPGAKNAPRLGIDNGNFDQTLTRIGDTDVYVYAETLAGEAGFRWVYEVDRKILHSGALELYSDPPEFTVQPSVPKGVLTQQPKWKSTIFPGTERDWWVYVPAQYKPGNPACVMVFQDGGSYKNYVPTVLDNLIAKGDMPVTVGIFINPGVFADGKSDRSFEYDTLSDQYARFLLEEILPEVEKTVKLRHDAVSRAIAGISSGGICAFTVAWEHPDQFSKVLSWVGSFTGIASGKTLKEGGNNYPVMIRKTERKPLRVFLQDGLNDLDNEHGNWPLANQEMAKALEYKQYDVKFVFGTGFHSDKHGRSILPDSLRWLWRDYKP